MTEKEFDQQIWRRYDSVLLDNGLKAIVSNVSFTTRCIRIYAKGLPEEWFKCDRIESHRSRKGDGTDDLTVIEELQQTIADRDKEINRLKRINNQMYEKLQSGHTRAILNVLSVLYSQLGEKKKRIDNINNCLKKIEAVLENIEDQKETEQRETGPLSSQG